MKKSLTQPVNKTTKEIPLALEYSPISLGKLRIWSSVQQSLATMQSLGNCLNGASVTAH